MEGDGYKLVVYIGVASCEKIDCPCINTYFFMQRMSYLLTFATFLRVTSFLVILTSNNYNSWHASYQFIS